MKRTKLGWLEEINARAGARTKLERYTPRSHIACVASVSARVRREKLGRGQKKGMTGKGEGKEGPFFCSRSNFRAISRLETLATQARSHTATVTHRGFIFRFHFPRVKAMWSKFSNQRMETSLPPSSVRVHRDGGWWAKRESQLRIHSFIRKEYTLFWRERHVRIPDHLCVWLKLKKEPEFPRNKKRIQSSGSDAREEEVRAWKHDVSFNRLATDYCI